MDLYPWRFDSILSHCHDDVISILNILKNFPCREVSRTSGTSSEKTGSSRTSPKQVFYQQGLQDQFGILGR
jgi:hypothetical protein